MKQAESIAHKQISSCKHVGLAVGALSFLHDYGTVDLHWCVDINDHNVLSHLASGDTYLTP